MKTIVIDPGHGGSDPGAVSGNRLEKDDNLRLALAVKQGLEKQGINVVMTRDTDVFVPLSKRSEIGNQSNGDIFVSLHRNSVDNSPNANGVEVIVEQGSDPINTTYAENVLNQLSDAGIQSDRGIKTYDLSVLRNSNIPAILVETGFISNAMDNRLFDQNFDAYADAIVKGILQSLDEPYIASNKNIETIKPVIETVQYASNGTAPSNKNIQNADHTIKNIQNALNKIYNAGLVVDGLYGPKTKKALIKGIQTEINKLFNSNLKIDGIFASRTKSEIPLIKVGTRGNLVYILEALLYINGYTTNLNGIFDINTETAVKDFQLKNGLKADGFAGPNTFGKLLEK